jgi:glycosyltransferase involved in cell wall biosynthesis
MVGSTVGSREAVIGTTPGAPGTPRGVNVIGDFAATTGLVEAGRGLVQAVLSAGIDVEVTDFDSPAPTSAMRRLRELEELPRGRRHDIELWFLNVNEFRHVDDLALRPLGDARRYVIGVWAWEAPWLPHWGRIEIERIDEIWVPSRFVHDSFRAATDKPITVGRYVVDPSLPTRSLRSDYDLPDDTVLFFFNFDANSSDGRKNPWGVIRAFESAFAEDERRGQVRLVFKTQNLDTHGELRMALQEQLDIVNGILVDGELSRERMNGLLDCIDVYASLHRSEGFGLGLAEAMFLAKPVIATAYSGNMDYTTRTNSCLVGYKLRPVEEADLQYSVYGRITYEPGLMWAEPDIAQAARWMRYLYDNPDERTRIGRAGAITVRNQFSPNAIQHIITKRLTDIVHAKSRESGQR